MRMLTTIRGIAASTITVCALALPATASAELAVAFSGGAATPYLTYFDTTTPGDRHIVPVTGVPAAPVWGFVASDIRPATGELYLLAIENPAGADDSIGTIWKIDLGTHVASQVGAAPFSTTLVDSANYGMDFNPTADRIRIISSANQNMRVNPDTGGLSGADTNLTSAFAHSASAVAYDRNVVGGGLTTAFVIDTAGDQLMRLGGIDSAPSPNGGVLTAVGALGVDVGTGAQPKVSMDISPTSGIAYLANSDAFFTETTTLYRVNLTTGVATNVLTPAGPWPFGALIGIDLLPPSSIAVATPAISAGESDGTATVTVARLGETDTPATVAFATADGTATAGSDYVAVSGTLAFASGVASRTIEVPIKPDVAVDAGETFTVTLSSVTGASAGSALVSTVTITDDDVADTVKPSVLLGGVTAKVLRLFNTAGARTQFSCSEKCTVRGTIKLGTRVLGTSSNVVVPAAGVSSVLVKPSRAGRRVLAGVLGRRGTQTVRLTFQVVATDAAGLKTTKLTTFALRG